jgi:uncharacterized Zn-finger protein
MLQREIGLKSLSLSGWSFFAINTMVVSFTRDGMTLVSNKDHTPFITSNFINSQFHWKNLAGKPSGPGAFSGPIWNRASPIS